MRLLFPLLFSCLILFACQNKTAPEQAQLGHIELNVTGDQAALPHFERGLLLLHNFEYEDARTHFQKAKKFDPDMAMAYWGEAMTYNHTLWASQYTDEAREVLNELDPSAEGRVAKASTDIERDFIRAVNILYSEEIEEKLERDVAYNAFMQEMYKTYDESHEVAAFYALSVLGSSPERDADTYGRGAIVVKGILAENPTHPGALHYLIHSYDDPEHAHLALDAANNYSKVAADAGHALHMPSHIYVALGMWDEVISSNIASFAATDQRRIDQELEADARNYHALEWLMYGYLQRGQADTARQLLDDMMGYLDEKPSPRARGYALMMQAGYLANTGDWNDPIAEKVIDISELNVVFSGVSSFVKGMGAYHSKDMRLLNETIDSMQARRISESKRLMTRGASMCSGLSWFTQLPTQTEINQSEIMEMELRAMQAYAMGDIVQAHEWFEKAVELEENTSYTFGPPVVVKPSFEMYAEFLFNLGEYEKAQKYVDMALEKTPGRRIPVLLKSQLEQKLNAI